MALDRRAREHDREPALLQRDEQGAGAGKRLDLRNELVEDRLPAPAQLVTELLLHLVAGDGGDVLVAAHADVPVELPHRDRQVVLTERAVPRERVVVVRVDERSVDVDDRRLGHYEAVACFGAGAPS